MRMMLRSRIIEDAGRVAENPIAPLPPAWRRLPAPGKTSLEQLAIRRLVTPDGDRRHRPESGSVVNEVATLEWDQYIMRVLVLRENRLYVHTRTLRPAPVQRALERCLGCDDPF